MGARSRSKGSTVSTPTSVQRKSFQYRKVYVSGQYVAQYQTVNSSYACGNAYKTDVQTMSDVTGSRSKFNACSHLKRQDFPLTLAKFAKYGPKYPPLSGMGSVWAEGGSEVHSPEPLSGLWPGPSTAALPNYTFPSIDWADLVNTVGIGLDGRMKSGQNMIVSTLQIAQTVNMVKSIRKMRKLISPRALRFPLGKVMKSTAGKYLEWQFGWKNLYRDIAAIAKVWGEVRQHLDYLRESVNVYTSLAARQKVSATGLPTSPLSTKFLQGFHYVSFSLAEVTRTACFSLDVRRTEQQIIWSKFDQIVSRLGGREIATALWDLVPFSFVVDWFTHVNRTIAQRSIRWNTHDLRYLGYSTLDQWFVKANHWSRATGYPSASSVVTEEMGPICVQSLYTRTPGFPGATSSVGLFGNLSKTQIAEGIALIVQRL